MQDKRVKKTECSGLCVAVLLIQIILSVCLPAGAKAIPFLMGLTSIVFDTLLLIQCQTEATHIPVKVKFMYAVCVILAVLQFVYIGKMLTGVAYCCLCVYFILLRQAQAGTVSKGYLLLTVSCAVSMGIRLLSGNPTLCFAVSILQVCLLLRVINPIFYKLAVQHKEQCQDSQRQKVGFIRKILFGKNGKWELPGIRSKEQGGEKLLKGGISKYPHFIGLIFLFMIITCSMISIESRAAGEPDSFIDLSKDGQAILYLSLQDIPPNITIKMPTWSENYGQDDITWYQKGVHSQFIKGSWTVNGNPYNYRLIVDKTGHKNVTYGLFHSHLYIGEQYISAYDYKIEGGAGYHVDYHNYGCARYTCASNGDGRIAEYNMGQWWESCQTCVAQGRPNRDFLVIESAEQFYYCYHYPQGIPINAMDGYHGIYRKGQCQYNKGWAKLDTRVSYMSHDYYFCPGHRTANTYTIIYSGSGATGHIEDSIFQYNSEKPLSKNLFQKEGYRFLGWSLSSDGTEISFKESQTVKNLTTENGAVIGLYAVWEEINPNAPTIQAEDIYIHKEDADTPINKKLLLNKAKASDIEDGDITEKIEVKNLNHVLSDAGKELTEEEIARAEKVIEVHYLVKDSGGKTADTKANLHIIFPVKMSEHTNGYVRFIDEPYVDDLPTQSRWSNKKAELKQILRKSAEERKAKTL